MAKQKIVINTKKTVTIKPKSREELSKETAKKSNTSSKLSQQLSQKAKNQKRGANGRFI